MTIRDDFLTNTAYGFPRGARRRITPKVLAVLHITANLAVAQDQRDYANRAGSVGPSAHYYLDRDGSGIRAIDPALYAAWSNGDVNAPKTDNAGITYLLKVKSGGFNVNEGCYLEIEHVGTATIDGQITAAQIETTAGLIVQAAKDTGLAIDATTVLPHAYINSVDRAHCPALDVSAFMSTVIARAQALAKEPDLITTITVLPFGGTFTIPAGATVVATEFDPATGTVGRQVNFTPADHPSVKYDATVTTTGLRGNPFVRVADGNYAGFLVSASGVNDVPNQPPATDCTQAIADARAAQKEADRTAAIAAVGKAIA